ncbi:NAD(P)/FAD-dependent oxidoreductase [Psychromarinibacter halotolerans]|uniref:NAD(P)/FAD-dependent oxidoreductase n=1 Tax=Psychromarinibacter halotolerans TaxID=1775175 RepID=A0ABV7H1L5_9RHOB|nr:FAD-binding oxidoreductase [Psychromarinibacter halotolerans]MDF0598639.1 FAD-binding oxidoreductase [Psychromarinibacter halotolerans]
MAMADVTVMGAGIFGVSVAYACARRGAKVQVIETRGLAAGASGGIVGALAPHVPENWNPKKQFQLESLLMQPAFWARVKEESNVATGYARLGRLQPLADDRAVALARQREGTAAELWGDAAEWRVIDAVEAGDWRPDSPTGLYVWDTLTARAAPRAACASLWWAANKAYKAQLSYDPMPQRGKVVWATGYEGLAELGLALGRNVGTGVKGQAVEFRLDAADRPQVFADGLHIVPHYDGTVAIGSTSERDFDDPETTDDQCDALIEKARAVFPPLRDAPETRRWAGVRPRARSRAPMLGAWPDRDGHFVANGGFKIGFGMAPKVGEVMADLVLEGRDGIPDGFRVEDSL